MSDGKWVSDVGPTTLVSDAARHVLDTRFEIVRTFLPLAVHEADEDPEFVHRLRVGTRRSGAALRIFASTLPEKAYNRARKSLRQIRRAAGEARDWDVFILALLERRKHVLEKELPGIDFLIGYGGGRRDAAQPFLVEAHREQGEGLRQLVLDTVAAIRDPEGETAPKTMEKLGGAILLDLLREVDFAASQNLDNYEHLHQVRILGKQLRYAMEVFADCFPPVFRDHYYTRIEEMQEMLGAANDSHVAIGRLAALRERYRKMWPDEWKRLQSGIEGLLRSHQRRLPRERLRFLKWWAKWQQEESEQLRRLLQGADSTPYAPA